jgi:hypothetical protein
MTLKRKIKFKFLRVLRNMGFICQKEYKPVKGIRVSKSIHPDGTETFYTTPLKEIPENKHDLESAIHIHKEIKKINKNNEGNLYK